MIAARYAVALLAVALTSAMTLTYCSSNCDCGGDAGNPCPGSARSAVFPGAACSPEGDSTCGYAAHCGHDISPDIGTTCTCVNGRWDCDTEVCPQCDDPIVIGAACSSREWCAGPTHAEQCDGAVVESVGGDAACGCIGSWFCDGVEVVSCDAGADAATMD